MLWKGFPVTASGTTISVPARNNKTLMWVFVQAPTDAGPAEFQQTGWRGGLPHLSTAHRTDSRELHTLKELGVYKRRAGLREKSAQSTAQTRETKPWIHQEDGKDHADQRLPCLLAPAGVPYPLVISLSRVLTQLSSPL